jgi:predicted nucleic acid-binding Zn ribbon protein
MKTEEKYGINNMVKSPFKELRLVGTKGVKIGSGHCNNCNKPLEGNQLKWCSEKCRLAFLYQTKRLNIAELRKYNRDYYHNKRKKKVLTPVSTSIPTVIPSATPEPQPMPQRVPPVEKPPEKSVETTQPTQPPKKKSEHSWLLED